MIRPLHSPAAAAASSAAAATARDTSAAMAVGVLMHRYSLARDEAAQRLQRLAQEAGVTLHAQAELLLAAVEQLAGPARH